MNFNKIPNQLWKSIKKESFVLKFKAPKDLIAKFPQFFAKSTTHKSKNHQNSEIHKSHSSLNSGYRSKEHSPVSRTSSEIKIKKIAAKPIIYPSDVHSPKFKKIENKIKFIIENEGKNLHNQNFIEKSIPNMLENNKKSVKINNDFIKINSSRSFNTKRVRRSAIGIKKLSLPHNQINKSYQSIYKNIIKTNIKSPNLSIKPYKSSESLLQNNSVKNIPKINMRGPLVIQKIKNYINGQEIENMNKIRKIQKLIWEIKKDSVLQQNC